MSSLRISHHNRAIGAANAGGDASSRPEKADDAGGFALALGAAGMVPKDAAALLGGGADDAQAGTGHARKKGDDPAANGAVPSSALAAQLLVVAPDIAQSTAASVTSGAAASGNAGGISAIAGAPAAIGAATTQPGGAAPAAGVDRAAIASTASRLLAATTPVTGTATAVSLPGPVPVANAGTEAPDGASGHAPADPSLAAVSSIEGAAVVPPDAARSVPNPTSSGVNQTPETVASVSVDPASAAAPPDPALTIDPAVTIDPTVTVSAAPAVAAPEPARVAGAQAAGSGWLPDTAFAVTADPGGAAAAPAAAPLAASNVAAPHVQPGLPASLSQMLPPVGATSFTAGSGRDTAFGGDTRDRFGTVAAPADAGSNAAAVLGDPAANAPLATAGLAAPGGDTAAGIAGALPDQVANQLVRMVSNGTRDMVMRLHPPELGDLTVRVAVSGRDVSAWFASPQPQVQSAINAALGQLQTDLGNAGYNLSGAWVGADASGGQQQAANLPAPLPRAPLAAPAAAIPVPAALRAPASGLNLYV